ncbi:putative E3 ubiquitin ligase [Abeliophyllum distichum]|uniref:RING-type E3 ubiquitin transferase n=1 Tax=Abeliophyllum distichum TaxID=126358 RepID=A0ABD1V8J9_9LAMI
MGNIGSSRVHGRRRSSSGLSQPPPPPPPPPPPAQVTQPEITANSYVFEAATPYPPSQYPNPNTPPDYPPAAEEIPVPLPAAANGRFPSELTMQPPQPYVEQQKAITIRNDVNLKKETLRIERDEANPGKFLVAFTFDALVAGRYDQ